MDGGEFSDVVVAGSEVGFVKVVATIIDMDHDQVISGSAVELEIHEILRIGERKMCAGNVLVIGGHDEWPTGW